MPRFAHALVWALPLTIFSGLHHPLCCFGMLLFSQALVRTYYWQLVPSTAGWFVLGCGWSTCSAIFGFLGIVANLLFPLPTLSPPKSKRVGVIDCELRGRHGESDHAVIGRIFYPAQKHNESMAYIAHENRHHLTRAFMTVAAPPALRPYLPKWLLSHWGAMRIPAKHGATPLFDEGPLPVVIFSHGLTATRETSTSLALALASEGVLVILLEHTDGSSSMARFADGSR